MTDPTQIFLIFAAGAFCGAVFVGLLVLSAVNRGLSDDATPPSPPEKAPRS